MALGRAAFPPPPPRPRTVPEVALLSITDDAFDIDLSSLRLSGIN